MNPVDYPEPIRVLIGYLKRLPGIGPKSAERIAIWILSRREGNFGLELSRAVTRAAEQVTPCRVCGFFSGDGGDCVICADSGRDPEILCVVEQPTDVLPLERTRAFRGRYHCLGGRISPLDNIGPDDLRIGELVVRLKSGEVRELILAMGSDVEGEATANYLSEVMTEHFPDLHVTQLAQGLPAGGGLEHADELTLFRALDGRKQMRK
jgi:recombination protein RecR